MATKSKSVQNKPMPVPDRLPEQPETPSDLFFVHDERVDSALKGSTVSDISEKLPLDAEYTLQKILFENKIAEISTHIAHELNEPLGAILVYAQLLLGRGNMDEITREGLDTIYREAQRSNAVIAALLSYARRAKPEKSLVSIQEVIMRSFHLLNYRLMENNIEVVVRLQPDMPKTMADPHQMQQVFTNIMTNAEQAMTEAHGKGKLHIKAQVAGAIIRITFDDDGPGIAQHNLKRIIDPLFTTKEAGLGLGLTICRAIVEGHCGSIYATNRPEKGATFVVELPIVA
jgi:two-component system NtrC family sensor kinase